MLLIDVGNTRLKYTFANRQNFSPIEAIQHEVLSAEWMSEHWKSAQSIYIASVAQAELVEHIKNWASSNSIECIEIKSEASYAGLINAYLKPELLGVDRWLAMLGARVLFPSQHLLVVDVGTATTIDLVCANGEHRGGWIFPGMQMLVNSVVSNTAKVSTETTSSTLAFGYNTSECLNFSAIAGTVALIEKARELANSTKEPDQIILLGGNASVIAPYLPFNTSIQMELIFRGLYEYSKDH